MANSNCNCSMSLLQKPCPRGVFDCRRCLAKMKNTKRVWQVTTTDNIVVTIGSTDTVANWPQFTTKLLWDHVLSIPSAPTGADYNKIKCNSGIWGEKPALSDGLVFSEGPGNPSEGVIRLSISLYFENTWWLTLESTRYYGGGLFEYDINGGFRIVSLANYETQKDSCFIFDPAEFTLLETSDSIVFDFDVTPPDTLPVIASSWPATISFQHVDAGDFNPVPVF